MRTEKRPIVLKSEVDAYLTEHGINRATARHRRRITKRLRTAKLATAAV